MMRMVYEREMYYFTGFDINPELPELNTVYWALVGNKLNTFRKEESAMRAVQLLKETQLHYKFWDDSEALIAGDAYEPEVFIGSGWEIQVVDLSNMGIKHSHRVVCM